MADPSKMTDQELKAEFEKYGETLQIPIKYNKRALVIKKLNHLRAKSNAQNIKLSSRGASSSAAAKFHASPSSKRTVHYADTSNLGALSSDDSDFEADSGGAYSDTTSEYESRRNGYENYHLNRSRSSGKLDDNRSEFQGGTGKQRKSNISYGSVARVTGRNTSDYSIKSKLYPDLNKIISPADESSDSDYDGNSKSNRETRSFGNKNYKNSLHAPSSSSRGAALSSSPKSPHHANSSSRGAALKRSGATQGMMERYCEFIPRVLVGLAFLFAILSGVYVLLTHDLTWVFGSSSMGVGDHLLLCGEDSQPEKCFQRSQVERALLLLQKLFAKLSVMKGKVVCDSAKAGSDSYAVQDVLDYIKKHETESDPNMLLKCCLEHILANPHWKISALKADGSPAQNMSDIVKLESQIPAMGFMCRLRRSMATVTFEIIVFISGMVSLLFLAFAVHYYLRQKKQREEEVYAMVDRIIEMLQDPSEQTRGDNPGDPPYLVVQHVRDRLLPLAERKRLQPVWNKAVEFIAANESRVRIDSRPIHGEEFDVWYWLQPNVSDVRTWQNQASSDARVDKFNYNDNRCSNNDDDDDDDDSLLAYTSPTPCLRVFGMLANIDRNHNLRSTVTEAILDRCQDVDSIVHIDLSVDPWDRSVYVKCSSRAAADRAKQELHRWWFQDKLVTVQEVEQDHYHRLWPESRVAIRPL